VRDHLRPLYAKDFRCIGSACEDNCCHGWDVTVDKASYEKYQAIPGLRSALNGHLVLTNHPTKNNHYALFKSTPSRDCPMLLSDGLCRIHKEYGETNLPHTCATYPRAAKRVDGLLENALLLSCPEAARLVLLRPQLLSRNGHSGEANRYSHLMALPDEPNSPVDDPTRYFWEGREFSLILVQDRNYPLWQRLFLLGIFCKRLDSVAADPRVGTVPQLLREYATIAAHGKLRSAMDGIPSRPEAQLRMILQVLQYNLNWQDPRFSRFRDCLRDFLAGTGHQDSAQQLDPSALQVAVTLRLDECLRHYVEAHDRYYAPFLDQHPYLLENYLINHILRLNFPFRFDIQDQRLSPQRQFLLLCMEFALIKGLLIGMAGHYKERFATEHVVKLVQVVAKSIEHSSNFLRDLNWQGLADNNSIAALLKN
jgi:lysine-N-methylase